MAILFCDRDSGFQTQLKISVCASHCNVNVKFGVITMQCMYNVIDGKVISIE